MENRFESIGYLSYIQSLKQKISTEVLVGEVSYHYLLPYGVLDIQIYKLLGGFKFEAVECMRRHE